MGGREGGEQEGGREGGEQEGGMEAGGREEGGGHDTTMRNRP